MPRGDRTGPRGFGPMTGRGFGYCAGYDAPGALQAGPGFGPGIAWRGSAKRYNRLGRGPGWFGLFHGHGQFGFGRRLGRGYYQGYYDTEAPSPRPLDEETALEAESSLLKNEVHLINERLKQITARIDEIRRTMDKNAGAEVNE